MQRQNAAIRSQQKKRNNYCGSAFFALKRKYQFFTEITSLFQSFALNVKLRRRAKEMKKNKNAALARVNDLFKER